MFKPLVIALRRIAAMRARNVARDRQAGRCRRLIACVLKPQESLERPSPRIVPGSSSATVTVKQRWAQVPVIAMVDANRVALETRLAS